MAKLTLSQMESREILPGFHGKTIHSEQMTFVYWDIEGGATLPEHDHPHEQVVNVLSGMFELTLNGERHLLEQGDVLLVPSNAPHSGRALTECRILDVFQPKREDYS
ncbi:cupin domain-containing protein [Pontibacter sp. G13]|uniref:cupin domain-containing protein n=1 Tax=Pontibacter sp. G13 TaxID=3074898 RepID=UPI00288AE8C0|nr:cupin domain-containing protein [Pontibacter sp. G13]WNJ17035.1 cupin domain-containing protein [Pontibacter sp. G13]